VPHWDELITPLLDVWVSPIQETLRDPLLLVPQSSRLLIDTLHIVDNIVHKLTITQCSDMFKEHGKALHMFSALNNQSSPV